MLIGLVQGEGRDHIKNGHHNGFADIVGAEEKLNESGQNRYDDGCDCKGRSGSLTGHG